MYSSTDTITSKAGMINAHELCSFGYIDIHIQMTMTWLRATVSSTFENKIVTGYFPRRQAFVVFKKSFLPYSCSFNSIP